MVLPLQIIASVSVSTSLSAHSPSSSSSWLCVWKSWQVLPSMKIHVTAVCADKGPSLQHWRTDVVLDLSVFLSILTADECLHAVRALAIPQCYALPPSSVLFVQSASLSPHTPAPLPCLSNGLRRLLVTMRGGAAWLASVLLFPCVSFQPTRQSRLISLLTVI